MLQDSIMLWLVLWLVQGIAALSLLFYLLSFRKVYSIRGKHVLITGGSSGIGKCLAIDAIKRGVGAVTIVARNEERLRQAKEEVESFIPVGSNQRVHMLPGDVSSPDIQDKLRAAVATNGHVDVLVNCAGITHTGTLVDTPIHKYEEILRVNVLGYVYTTKTLLPAMIEKRQGRVVFVSSQAGQLGIHGYTAYSTSKYALKGLAETLNMEVAPYNVKVCISFPPDTNTPQLQAEIGEREDIQKELATFGKVFEPESIAEDIWTGVERRKFQITHGFDGFLLGVMTAGMGPVHCWWDATVQVLLMSLFRAISFVYLTLFYRVVFRHVRQAQKTK